MLRLRRESGRAVELVLSLPELLAPNSSSGGVSPLLGGELERDALALRVFERERCERDVKMLSERVSGDLRGSSGTVVETSTKSSSASSGSLRCAIGDDGTDLARGAS